MNNQQTANSKAIVNSIKFFAGAIILAAVVYSEILFLGIISSIFPSGPLAIGAMIGAVTTGLSIIALCLGKGHWFRPGQQLIVAWIFTVVEIGVLILNDMLAYQLHTGARLDQFMATWKLFCVAAPAFSLVGWVLLFYFDPARSIMHKRMEMEDNQAKAKIDLDVKAHQKAMAFHYRAIDMVGSGMEAQMERLMPHYTEMAARQKLAEIASDLTGRHVSHGELGAPKQQLPAGSKIVEADPPQQQAASRDHVVDPTGVRSQVNGEKKNIEKKPLIDFSIPKGVSAKMTQKIDTAVADPEEEEERPILEEKPNESPRTRRVGGDPEMEAEEEVETVKDTTEMTMDEAWQEYNSVNAQAPVEAPVRKGKGGRKPKN